MRWRVSAREMALRLNSLGLFSDWQYKSICIELGNKAIARPKPGGIERERSVIWRKVLSQLWSEKITKNDTAAELNLPLDETGGSDLEFSRR